MRSSDHGGVLTSPPTRPWADVRIDGHRADDRRTPRQRELPTTVAAPAGRFLDERRPRPGDILSPRVAPTGCAPALIRGPPDDYVGRQRSRSLVPAEFSRAEVGMSPSSTPVMMKGSPDERKPLEIQVGWPACLPGG